MRMQWAVVTVAVLACSESATITPPLAVDADAIEHDVWVTVIADLCSHFREGPALLSANALQAFLAMHKEESSSDSPWSDPPWSDSLLLKSFIDSVPGLDREIFASFHRRNADSGSIETPLRLGVPYLWITREQLLAGRAVGHPEHLYGVDDHLIIGLSHVGFTRDYRWAILYRDYSCGALCGAGEFLLMERRGDDIWRIRQAQMAWVS
jgi:hypothetical protein